MKFKGGDAQNQKNDCSLFSGEENLFMKVENLGRVMIILIE